MGKNSTNNLSFGERLANIRKAKGITQKELGERIGVSQRIMNHYEKKAEYPPTQKLIELARALDMGIDELLGIASDGNDAIYNDIKPGLARKLRQASQLPPQEIKALSTFIDALIIKQQVNTDTAGAAK
jgi:transcriptional regulator with XRE-family HTH domain